MSFEVLGLSAELLRAIREQGYVEPTPVQRQAIPVILQARDVMVTAQTALAKPRDLHCLYCNGYLFLVPPYSVLLNL